MYNGLDEIQAIPNTFNLIVSIFSGIKLFNALLFQGVISDIATKYSNLWFAKVFAICIVACVLFIIQCIFCAKTVSISKGNHN